VDTLSVHRRGKKIQQGAIQTHQKKGRRRATKEPTKGEIIFPPRWEGTRKHVGNLTVKKQSVESENAGEPTRRRKRNGRKKDVHITFSRAGSEGMQERSELRL